MKIRVPKYKIEEKLREENKCIVYTLRHPNCNDIFYVGVTSWPSNRRTQHRRQYGRLVIMEEVETVKRNGFGYSDVVEIEQYWISQFKSWGFDLKNKYGVRDRLMWETFYKNGMQSITKVKPNLCQTS